MPAAVKFRGLCVFSLDARANRAKAQIDNFLLRRKAEWGGWGKRQDEINDLWFGLDFARWLYRH
jgi:hypothetical protein